MTWLHEHGAIANYDDYVGLPAVVLSDCRLVMQAEAENAKRQERRRA